MTRKLVPFRAGVVKDDSAATAEGYAIDTDQARIVSGRFQSVGGFGKYSLDSFSGPARGGHDWTDRSQNAYFAWGSYKKLYAGQGALIYPITPERSSGTFVNNPFTTTSQASSGAVVIVIAASNNGAVTGDTVLIGGATAFDNVQVGGTTGSYPASNPFQTVSGSKTVLVSSSNHGLATGDVLRVPTSSSVGGITLGGVGSGAFSSTAFITVEIGSPLVSITYSGPAMADGEAITISGATSNIGGVNVNGTFYVSVPSSGTLTIETASNATSITSGGGASGIYRWQREYIVQVMSADSYAIDHAFAATSTTSGGGAATYDTAKQYIVTTSGTDQLLITATSTGATTGATGGGASARYLFELSIGNEDGQGGDGYSSGPYGTGLYGLSTPATVTYLPRVWAFDNRGSDLFAMPLGGRIYRWLLNKSFRAFPLTNAPLSNLWMLTTNENSIMTLGCTDTDGSFDPLAYRASDPANPNIWVPSLGNNSFEDVIGAGSRFIGAQRTKTGIFAGTDLGSQFIRFTNNPDQLYEATVIGESAGWLGPLAAVENDGRVVWLSPSFVPYEYTGGTPYPLPCLVKQWAGALFDRSQAYKTFVHFDNEYTSVWFRFPGASGEVDTYFACSLPDRTADGKGGWFVGTSDLTTVLDRGIFSNPLGFSAGGSVYTLESGNSADGAALPRYVRYAPIDWSDKDSDSNRVMFARYVGIDGQLPSGNMAVTLYGQRELNGVTQTVAAGTISQGDQDRGIRIQARRIGLELRSSGSNDEWRLGDIFFDITPTSRR